MPLWKRGNDIVKQPLHLSCFGDGIFAALDNPDTMGATIEALGPDRFLLGDLMDWMHEVMHKDPDVWGYRRTDLRWDIRPLIWAWIIEKLPVGQKISRGMTIDKIDRVSTKIYAVKKFRRKFSEILYKLKVPAGCTCDDFLDDASQYSAENSSRKLQRNASSFSRTSTWEL